MSERRRRLGLILTRRPDEAVVILLPDGRRIRVAVAEFRGGAVRLGFDAPADILVHREEVLEEVEAASRDKHNADAAADAAWSMAGDDRPEGDEQ